MIARWTTLDGKAVDLRKRLGRQHRRRISRAISIASQPVEATMNDSLAADVAESHEGQEQ